jgi:hypothetical protein
MPNAQTRETLAADIWRACDILRHRNDDRSRRRSTFRTGRFQNKENV